MPWMIAHRSYMTHSLVVCTVQGDKFGYSVNFDLHPMAASCNPGHVRVSKLYVQVRYSLQLHLSCL